MENRGLCNTCVSEKGCVFPRKFPVLQCEEFSNYFTCAKVARHTKSKATVSSSEATEAE